MHRLILSFFFVLLFLATGCQEEAQQPEATKEASKPASTEQTEPAAEEAPKPAAPEEPQQQPPTPPVFEDFQGEPQLSLFPRVGDFRPADDSDRLPYWQTFIEHVIKVTGVVEEPASGNRAWTFRSINTIDSLGFFSPLAVEPLTAYQVSFRLTADLAEGASAGIGILEFNEFIWIPAQYTEEIYNQHFRGSQEGRRLTGKVDGEHRFSFTTGPETKMIHLVLFREGAHDRNNLMFDDIGIDKVKGER